MSCTHMKVPGTFNLKVQTYKLLKPVSRAVAFIIFRRCVSSWIIPRCRWSSLFVSSTIMCKCCKHCSWVCIEKNFLAINDNGGSVQLSLLSDTSKFGPLVFFFLLVFLDFQKINFVWSVLVPRVQG